MSERIEYEALLILLSFVTGAWLMAVYDVLRVLRFLFAHSMLAVSLEDFFYWGYAGLVTFFLLYEQNDGRFRFFVIIGVFLGMLLYDRIVSRFFFRCLKKAGIWVTIKRNSYVGFVGRRAGGRKKRWSDEGEVLREVETDKTV